MPESNLDAHFRTAQNTAQYAFPHFFALVTDPLFAARGVHPCPGRGAGSDTVYPGESDPTRKQSKLRHDRRRTGESARGPGVGPGKVGKFRANGNRIARRIAI